MTEMDEAVSELEAEQAEIETVLRSLAPDAWRTPTPAAGWDIRDTVSHLADTNEIAHDTASGGPRQLNQEALDYESPEAFTEMGCEKGRRMEPAAVLDWWRSSADRVNEVLRAKDPKERIPWGLGMSARMLATARLMEHWAHGLDIRAAAGLEPNFSARLQSVAFLIYKAMPYAFGVVKVEQPVGTLRVELDAEGDRWVIGPEDADNVISGDALEYCRVGVQRMRYEDAKTLKAQGPLAEAALRHARAFL